MAVALLAAIALPSPAAAASRAERPNVVVIMTDDQDFRSMPVMPKTRRLIGAAGVTFDRNFVNYPLCCPSRATFLTGQYAHNHGVLWNNWPRRRLPDARRQRDPAGLAAAAPATGRSTSAST